MLVKWQILHITYYTYLLYCLNIEILHVSIIKIFTKSEDRVRQKYDLEKISKTSAFLLDLSLFSQ